MNEKLKAALKASIKSATVTLSDGKKVSIRPIMAAEYRLMVEETEKGLNTNDLMISIIKRCITSGNLDVDKLPIHDFERIYFEIYKLGRSNSMITIPFVCRNEIDSVECGSDIEITANLNMAMVSSEPERMVQLTDRISVQMRYPTVIESELFNIEKYSDLYDLAWRLVEAVIIDGQTMKVGLDVKPEDLTDLTEYLDQDAITKLLRFAAEIPTITLDVPVKCPKCGHYEPYRLSGITDICL
ncbi:hypothetical protein [Aeromonas hydrophila]|uniref:T4 family baseplate hub assembly chaperone n=1 Tax=Aeromonas hydrophila TaxID=644 RepID=UPI001583B017|nr:hypothetical protein [Aeromonas hydrophila]